MDWTDLIIPGAAAAVGSLFTNAAARKQLQQQQGLNQAMADYRSQQAAKTRAPQQDFMASMQPQARAQQQAQTEADLGTSYGTTMAGIKAGELPDTTAGTSPEYAAAKTAADARTNARLSRALQQYQTIGAQDVMRQQDAIRAGRAAYDIGAANNAAGNVSSFYQNAIGQTQPDPRLRLLGEAFRGFALGYPGMKKNQAAAEPTGAGAAF